MKLTILGSGVCANDYLQTDSQLDQRYPPAYLLEFNDKKILFDCSELVRFRLERAGFNYADIHHLAISHAHPDHFALVHYLQSVFCKGIWGETKNKQLNIYCPGQIEKDFADYWQMHLPEMDEGERYEYPELDISAMSNNEKKKISKAELNAFPVYHGFGKVDALGYRLESSGKVFAYSGDTGLCDNLLKLADSADLFLCEASADIDDFENAKEYGHLNPQQAGEVAAESEVKHLVLTHYNGKTKQSNMKSEVRAGGFEGELSVAEDFVEFTF